MQSFDSLSLHCRFYPGLCEATRRGLHTHASYLPKTGCKCSGECKLRPQACNQVIIAIFEMWRGGWQDESIVSRMKTVAAGGVVVGLNKGQSHQLLSCPLKAADSLISLYFDFFFFWFNTYIQLKASVFFEGFC